MMLTVLLQGVDVCELVMVFYTLVFNVPCADVCCFFVGDGTSVANVKFKSDFFIITL